jgi:hypothetical protein
MIVEMNNGKRSIMDCPHCSNVVEGKIKRGLIRGTLHDGPAAVVDLIPVGGKLVWKCMKEVVKILLRTDVDKWGDEVEKWVYKDIEVEYHCPKCGKQWIETQPLSESEYKQMVNGIIEQAKAIICRQSPDSLKFPDSDNKLTSTNQQEINSKFMRLQIPYNELEQYVSKNFQQKQVSMIGLAYVDESTIKVSAVVKMIISKEVDVNVSVKEVDGSDVTLTYQAGMAIELMAKGVLKWYEDVVKDMLEEQDNNTLLVHLDKIDQLKPVLEKVEIQSINFDPDYINLCFALR